MSIIVSIHSFRGGTGKSNVTANLAAQAALAGKRVGIIDTDINSPGIHVPFGLDERSMGRTLNEYLRAECNIEDVAFPVGENVGSEPGRQKLAGKTIWLVPSSIKSTEISQVLRDGYDVGRLNEGMQSLLKKFKLDFMFIDTHPGLNEETLLSIAVSDILILILRPDQQDFQGTAVTIDVSRGLDVPSLYLVVNKALTNRYDPANIRKQVEQTFGAPVAGVLPLSEDLVDLGSKDIFSLREPDHPWSKELRKIAQVVLGI
ncbi:MAG: MinD/ParA family protein [Anaerolineales bacterium]|nr:MinD/ParA family protein [Anaerolineales bacterium]